MRALQDWLASRSRRFQFAPPIYQRPRTLTDRVFTAGLATFLLWLVWGGATLYIALVVTLILFFG